MNHETTTKSELIREIKSLKSTLKESEQKYQRLFETANDAIFVADVKTGIILSANNRAGNMLGMPVKEIVDMSYTQIHPAEDKYYNIKLFEKYSKIDKSVTTEDIFVQHKDGHKIPVEISSSVFELGGRKAILGIFRDITERKEVEKRLKDTLGQSHVWLENSPVCTKVVDLDFNLRYMSAAGTKKSS